MNKFLFALLICIISVGFFLRVYKLDSIPFGFFCDEASIGYNAYSILTTGKDEYGTSWPLFFRAFGEYKGPIQIYASVPFIALLGLNEFSTRFTSVFFGTLGILAIFFLTRILCNKHENKNLIGLLAALFLAISPWHIHLSRVAFEMTPFILFTTLGVFCFLKAKNQSHFLFISIASFTMAFYSYFPARIFLPLFGIGLLFFLWKYFKRKLIVLTCAVALLAALIFPVGYDIVLGNGLSRFHQVSIFSHPPKDESIVIHIIKNYASHFSLDFLFLKGDIDMPGQFITRHSARGMGELYLIQLLLIIVGIIFLWKKKNYETLSILLWWLILYPSGSMFTLDASAQATRSIIGIIPFQILSAFGLYSIIKQQYRFKTITVFLTSGLLLLSFFYFLFNYFIAYPKYSSDYWGWQYGPKKIVNYFVLHENFYDDLYMIGEFNAPEIFFKFYAPNDCSKCKIGTPTDSYNKSRRQLFAVSPTYLKTNPGLKFIPFEKIFYPDGSTAFIIGQISN